MGEERRLEVRPIGVIRSPYKARGDAPRQGRPGGAAGTVEVFSEFEEGLKDIEGFSHVLLIYWFDRAPGYSLTAHPPSGPSPRGVFASRSPRRPNPLGLGLVELLGRKGNILEVRGLDALDGTPLLDIKPYIPHLDEGRPGDSGSCNGDGPHQGVGG